MIKTPTILAPAQLEELALAVTCEVSADTDGCAAEDEAVQSAASAIDAGRMAAIKDELSKLEAKAPPAPRGKPTDEEKAVLQAHSSERESFEKTLSEQEIKACVELLLYVRAADAARKKAKKGGKKK